MISLASIYDPIFDGYEVIADTTVVSADGKKVPSVKFRAPVQLVGRPNGNKRIYPEETIEEVLKQAHYKIQRNALYGEPNHPKDNDPERQADTPILESSHLWTKIWREGDYIFGEGVTIPTFNGIQLAEVIKFGAGVGFSVRMLGTNVRQTQDGFYVIQPPIIFVTYDAVSTPAVKEAYIREWKLTDSQAAKLFAKLTCSNGVCKPDIIKDFLPSNLLKRGLQVTKYEMDKIFDRLVNNWTRKFFVI